MRQAPDIEDQLRQAILGYEGSRAYLSRWAGVAQATISRFVRGQRGMTLRSANGLAFVLKLTLRPRHTTTRARTAQATALDHLPGQEG